MDKIIEAIGRMIAANEKDFLAAMEKLETISSGINHSTTRDDMIRMFSEISYSAGYAAGGNEDLNAVLLLMEKEDK